MSPNNRPPVAAPAVAPVNRASSIRTPAYEAFIARLRVETASRALAKKGRH